MDYVATARMGAADLDRETAGLLRRWVAVIVDNLVFLPLSIIIPLSYRDPFSDATIFWKSVQALPQLLLVPVASLFGSSVPWMEPFLSHRVGSWLPWVGLAVSFAYGTLLLGRWGRTVGMMALRVRVTGRDGFDIGLARAALRTAAYHLPFAAIPTLLWFKQDLAASVLGAATFIGLLWIMVDRAHQGYHDKIAGTFVMLERCYRERHAESIPEPGPEP